MADTQLPSGSVSGERVAPLLSSCASDSSEGGAETFLLDHYRDQILDILREEDNTVHYGLAIEWVTSGAYLSSNISAMTCSGVELLSSDPHMFEQLVATPMKALPGNYL